MQGHRPAYGGDDYALMTLLEAIFSKKRANGAASSHWRTVSYGVHDNRWSRPPLPRKAGAKNGLFPID